MKKQCSCCGFIQEIPEKIRPWMENGVQLGFFFECLCGSTLLVLTIDKTKLKDYHFIQAQ